MLYSFFTKDSLRLDEFLRIQLPSKLENSDSASNSKIRRLIVAGCVFVNGKTVVRPSFMLRGRSTVKVDFDEEKFFFEKEPEDIKFELSDSSVLYEDDYLILVNKPAFFPTEETIVGDEKRDNLHAAVVRYLWKKNPDLKNPPYCGIMHRLDRETSGVILFTKDRSVNKDIQKMFETHDFKKLYVALCTKSGAAKGSGSGGAAQAFLKKKQESCENKADGIEKQFTVEFFMNRISPKSQAAKWGQVPEDRGGLYSKTAFTVLEEPSHKSKFYRVQADLFTGRTHQIRVHLAAKGMPILGDGLYGGGAAERIMLHAEKLIFVHPVTGENLEITAPVPF